MIRGRVGVWDPSKLDDVIYEQPLIYTLETFIVQIIGLNINFKRKYKINLKIANWLLSI